jgi:peroxiredoxin
MPHIQDVFEDKEWSDKGLVILAIDIAESPSEVQDFMESNNLSFQVLMDGDGKVAERYNVRGIPTSIFIDKEGIIQVIKVGAFPNKAAIEKNLSKIIP